MANNRYRQFIGKVLFKGVLVLKTGLHIGGNADSMQIGGVDLPVIKDSSNNLPYIPGSSLKGKLRSILEKFGKRKIDGREETLSHNRNIGTRWNPLFIHCCEDTSYAMACEVCRIFGSSGDDRAFRDKKEKAENMPSLLFVRDCLLVEDSLEADSLFTEVKTETGVDRATMAANPRRVERVLPHTRFCFEMVYNVDAFYVTKEKQLAFNKETLKKDLDNILTCMELLESEGLGGYTSRGYGKVSFLFEEFTARTLKFYQGEKKSIAGKTIENGENPFTIEEARGHIETITTFLKT
ncbi:MAG: type III-A CRISPR-associated RAMP protein Csm3 [Spirochaetales bacterium]|nr:type III-A CRISPR-associated RAMP protein Csm3 [Spirochaetales bacterium]